MFLKKWWIGLILLWATAVHADTLVTNVAALATITPYPGYEAFFQTATPGQGRAVWNASANRWDFYVSNAGTFTPTATIPTATFTSIPTNTATRTITNTFTATFTNTPTNTIQLINNQSFANDGVKLYPSPTWTAVPGLVLSTPKVQILTSSSGTFTCDGSPLYLEVILIGPGGGGGSNGSSATSGSAGSGPTTFGSFLSASAGSGGDKNQAVVSGGAGGSGGTISAPALTIYDIAGQNGGGVPGIANGSGGPGGNTILIGGAPMCSSSHDAVAAVAHTGGGGGGSGGTSGSGGGGGGGGGESICVFIPAPVATYVYSIPAGGAAGTMSGGGQVASAGAAGQIIVKEYYQ